MKRLKRIIFGILLAAGSLSANSAATQPNTWLPVKDVELNAKKISEHPDIDIFTDTSRIIVSVNEQTKIDIFTILGKLVSSAILKPGIYEYKLSSHGIYVIKCSDKTYKVAV